MRAVTTHLLPLGFSLAQTKREVIGGYFMWLTLSPDLKVSAKLLTKRCLEEENVVVAGGNLFEVPGEGGKDVEFERNVRLCWAWEDEWKLEEGARRVGVVVRRLLEDGDAEGEFLVVTKEDGDMVDEFK